MMKSKNFLTMVLAVLFFALILPAVAMAQAVTTECAYTTTGGANGFGDIECYVYVDATGGLISGGVSLQSSNLTVASVTNNGNRWFFGDGPPPLGYDCPNCTDVSNPSAPVVLVGHYDTSATPTIVDGNRELIGTFLFDRTNSDPPNVVPQLGRGGDYVNFVAVDGTPLDGSIIFNPAVIGQRGDADLNGTFSIADMIQARSNINNTQYSVFSDCDGNGTLSIADMICIKDKI